MFSSNCCFWTHIQVSQKAGNVVWYSHLFKNFLHGCDPQNESLSSSHEAEVDFFQEFPCFFYDAVDIGNLISGSSAFSKSSLYIWKFSIHILLKDFEYCLANM